MKKGVTFKGMRNLSNNSGKAERRIQISKQNATRGKEGSKTGVYPSAIGKNKTGSPKLQEKSGYRHPQKKHGVTAIVYCEGQFGEMDGKTANGLIRQSEKYTILAIIDSEKEGLDSGAVLGQGVNGIPICRDLTSAIAFTGEVPDFFIFGKAPASGMLSLEERAQVLKAMALGMDIVSGLHQFLNDDSELVTASHTSHVELIDVRMPPTKKPLQTFRDLIDTASCPRLAVLGTDCAIGKRTTATILVKTLKEMGLKAVLISTGQTGLIQGARYGVALDAIPSQFCPGELEAVILKAFEKEDPDILVIEGQGAVSHPAFSTSCSILRGSRPHAVVLQHAPGRLNRCDFLHLPMPTVASEIHMIETFSKTRVIGLAINHENMTEDEVEEAVLNYQVELGIPAADPLRQPEKLAELVLAYFPILEKALSVCP